MYESLDSSPCSTLYLDMVSLFIFKLCSVLILWSHNTLNISLIPPKICDSLTTIFDHLKLPDNIELTIQQKLLWPNFVTQNTWMTVARSFSSKQFQAEDMACNGVEVGGIKGHGILVQYFLAMGCRQQEPKWGMSLVCRTKGLVTEEFEEWPDMIGSALYKFTLTVKMKRFCFSQDTGPAPPLCWFTFFRFSLVDLEPSSLF